MSIGCRFANLPNEFMSALSGRTLPPGASEERPKKVDRSIGTEMLELCHWKGENQVGTSSIDNCQVC